MVAVEWKSPPPEVMAPPPLPCTDHHLLIMHQGHHTCTTTQSFCSTMNSLCSFSPPLSLSPLYTCRISYRLGLMQPRG